MEEINSQIKVDPPLQVIPTSKPKLSSKIPLLAVFVILMMSLSAGATYLILKSPAPVETPAPIVQTSPAAIIQPTPTSDPTANWKTYEFSKMKIRLKMPPEWFSHDEEEWPIGSGNFSVTISFPMDNASSQNFSLGQIVMLSLVKQTNNLKIIDEATERINMPASTYNKTTTFVTVGGREAIVLRTIDGYSKTVIIDGVGTGNYLATLTLSSETKNSKIDEMIKTFDQILSTLKFLD